MKIFVSFTLWLLLGTISANESVDCQQTFPQDIYAALREMTASLVQLKADVTTLQREFLQTQGTVMDCCTSCHSSSEISKRREICIFLCIGAK